MVVFNEVEENYVIGPVAADDATLNEYNMLCASEYGSKASGTGKASTPLAPGILSFSQTPIYARVTAHISKEAPTAPKSPPVEAID